MPAVVKLNPYNDRSKRLYEVYLKRYQFDADGCFATTYEGNTWEAKKMGEANKLLRASPSTRRGIGNLLQDLMLRLGMNSPQFTLITSSTRTNDNFHVKER
jgi:hypothetical protein